MSMCEGMLPCQRTQYEYQCVLGHAALGCAPVHTCKRFNAFNERNPKGSGGCRRGRGPHIVLFIITRNPDHHPSEHPLVGGEKVRGD